jgi:hypothetical protein
VAVYTKELQAELQKVPCPYPGEVIVDFLVIPETLQLEIRVYEDNIMSFESDQRVTIMFYLEKLKAVSEKHGLKAVINGVVGDPPRLRRAK